MTATRFSDLTDENDLTKAYRKWVRLVHPDTVTAQRRATATQAMAKLADLYNNQGSRSNLFASGDIAELYHGDGNTLIKVPRNPADNDLMITEAEALHQLHHKGDPRFRAYAPRLVDSFVHEDNERIRRNVNVIKRQRGMRSVHELKPDLVTGIWIWRRLLTAIGWAHRAGVVHGAVIESHVLIHLHDRGLVLVDWCYAGHRPQAIVKAAKPAYPPEVLKDKSASAATDIYMATGLMTRLLGAQMPQALRNFATGCSYDSPRMRPQDAWELLAEFDEIIPQRHRN
ncbi:molecular chaperone DnaJ [Actinoplanes sp. GCM10030250]|uniref:molecular chaperone DnaJ n=1 Tax=Actinoplanes sp. GCM10030250 TaxID=3273376 RepID=UPI00361F3A8F